MSENDEDGTDQEVVDETWYTKDAVAAQLGKSLAAVTRLQKAGRLSPRIGSDGKNRYNPREVAEVMSDPSAPGRASTRGEEFAEYQLDTVRALIGLVKDPRERIDEIQFRIIERLEKENNMLRDRLEANRVVVEAAQDNNADRQAALNIMNSETRVKELAGMRMIETLSRLISGGKSNGVQLSPEQLEQLIMVGDFLTPEQANAAKAAVVAYRSKMQANGNGKKEDSLPLDNVMKAVVDAATEKPIEGKNESQ